MRPPRRSSLETSRVAQVAGADHAVFVDDEDGLAIGEDGDDVGSGFQWQGGDLAIGGEGEQAVGDAEDQAGIVEDRRGCGRRRILGWWRPH